MRWIERDVGIPCLTVLTAPRAPIHRPAHESERARLPGPFLFELNLIDPKVNLSCSSASTLALRSQESRGRIGRAEIPHVCGRAFHCQRPPAFAHSFRWSTQQKASATRCSPRCRTRRTCASVSSAPQCEQSRRAFVEAGPARPMLPRFPVRALDATTGSGARGGRRRRAARPPARRRGSRRRARPRPRTRCTVSFMASSLAPPRWPALRIVVLEGDQTGQELLEQALRVISTRT